ncbi:hypothetical protein [Brevundimonas bacteroides]|uniref:hypothetical protein n=1 Tax=Brevundimonas bacteroides TaxID=74311 RepID=UPI00054EA24C|nr:hypothetical protein [Brevundimonas bacteroides]
MTETPDTPRSPAREPEAGLHHLSEDATGFGQRELRTVRDAFVKPVAMLDAYMTLGPSGGGVYARPLRFYLSLCGILMLQLFLMGGTTIMFSGLPPEALDPVIAQSGKSRDAFLADADGWMSLVLVPLNAAAYAIVSAPLLRWWDPTDLGWRKSFRATFHYLNVWTLPFIPIGFLAYMPATAVWASIAMLILGFIAFLRVGRGRWYRTPVGGAIKAVTITAATFVGTMIASVPMMAIGLAGGVWG